VNLSIRASIALWLILTLPNNLLAARSATTKLVTQNPPSQHPAEIVTDLAIELAAADNLPSASELFDRAVQIALEIEAPVDRLTTLTEIATKMAAAGEQQRALAVLERAVKLVSKDDYLTLSAIALDIAKLGKKERALQLFDRSVKVYQRTIKKGEPNADIYFRDRDLVSVIINMAKAGEIDRALQVTQKLSFPLSQAQAFNGIATALIAAGKTEAAKAPLERALEITSKLPDDDISYSYMSNGSCGNDKFALLVSIGDNLTLLGQIDRALKIATKIYGCSSASGDYSADYQLAAFTGILNHLANKEEVKQLWSSARTVRSNSEKGYIWSAIALKLIALGETEIAFNIAEKIAAEGTFGSSLDPPFIGAKEEKIIQIAFKLSEAGDTERSQKITEKMNEPIKSQVKALLAIPTAGKLYQQNKPEQADTLLSQSLQLPQIDPDPSRVYDDYNLTKSRNIREQIAVELAKIGQVERALQIRQTINEEWWQQDVLKQIILVLVEKGEIESAFQIAKNTSNRVALVEFLEVIAPKLTTKEQVETAWQIAQKILADRKVEDTRKDAAIAVIAPKLIEIGEVDRGLQLAKTTKSESVQLSVARQLAKSGETAQAWQILQPLPEPSAKKAEAIVDLAVLLTKSSK
jgi:tetratricopeptide (TPR) repeat protein